MPRLRSVLIVCAFICAVGIFAAPAHADNVYYVAGSATVVGNDACGASPCTEWINFSFDLTWQPFASYYNPYYSNLVTNYSGSLGSFTQSGPALEPVVKVSPLPPGQCGSTDFNYIPFFSTEMGEVDINLCGDTEPQAPVAPQIDSYGQLYSCATAACVTDFAPPIDQGQSAASGIFGPVSVEASVQSIPESEPSTITLLAVGMLALALEAIRRRLAPLRMLARQSGTSTA